MRSVLTTEASASRIEERANKVLDNHIEAGGAHGERAQRIKDKLNDGGTCGAC